jgi:3,4-dihydroxy 2-butanone 4-phosphate synthase/GTP cyclohydrolase II
MAFMVRHTSGVVAVALEAEICTRLRLPAMPFVDHEDLGTPPTVTVDAAVGITTGISAKDRAATARSLADPRTSSDDLTRPGHMQPLRVRGYPDGTTAGRAEAAVVLARMAGMSPAAVLCELVSVHDPRRMARAEEAHLFAAGHGLIVVGIGEIMALRRTWVA